MKPVVYKSIVFPAVIPLTDSSHSLLPLHFAVDPGAEFVWNRDELDEGTIRDLGLHPNTHLNLLNTYMEVVRVALPEWLLEGVSAEEQYHHEQQQQRGCVPRGKQVTIV